MRYGLSGNTVQVFLTDGGAICHRQAGDRPLRARNIKILVDPSSRVWQLNHPSAGILNLLSIAYAYWLQLRIRLTPGGRPLPGKPWAYGGRDSCPAYRYSCLHSHFLTLHVRFPLRFDALRTLPYQSVSSKRNVFQSFGIPFIANHYRREIAR